MREKEIEGGRIRASWSMPATLCAVDTTECDEREQGNFPAGPPFIEGESYIEI